MESILDDLDAMIGELDDLNFNPNEIKPKIKKHLDEIEVDGKENQSDGEGFAALISELASFNPEPVNKLDSDKSNKKIESAPPVTKPAVTKPAVTKPTVTNLPENNGFTRGGSLRSNSEEKTLSRTSSRERTLSRSNTERKRTLSRQNSGLDSFTLLPSPSENIRIHMSDGNIVKTVRVERNMSAWDLSISLVLRNAYSINSHWTLVEQLVDISCERVLEDHEIALKVYKGWPHDSNNKMCLVENDKKWDFLLNPQDYFPKDLAVKCSGKDEDDILEVLTQEYFSDSPPPVEGYLYCKDQKHSWSRKYFVLRSSGLYYSCKGKSKAPQDLSCFTTLQDTLLYYCVDARTDHKAPTEHALCFKIASQKTQPSIKDLRCVAAESEHEMLIWYEALRVMKYGDKISENRAIALLEVAQELENKAEERRNAPPPTPPPIATIPKDPPPPTLPLQNPISSPPTRDPPPSLPQDPPLQKTHQILIPSGNPAEPWAPIPVSIPSSKFPLFNPITAPPPQKPIPPLPPQQKPIVYPPPLSAAAEALKPLVTQNGHITKEIHKKTPPPPPSPKPVQLEKPVIRAPKPSPVPKRRMQLPVPPTKPKFDPPLPPTASDPPLSAPPSSPPASSAPQPTFSEVQAQLAKSFNSTLRSPAKPVKPAPVQAAPVQKSSPVAFDDLPPPPPDFLVEQPAISQSPHHTEQPQRPVEPITISQRPVEPIMISQRPVEPITISQRPVEKIGPKISDILKSMQSSDRTEQQDKTEDAKPPSRLVSALTHQLNSKPLPMPKPMSVFEIAKRNAAPSPPSSAPNSTFVRSQTCPLLPQQHNSLVARMAQELAGKMVHKSPHSNDAPRENNIGNIPQSNDVSRQNNIGNIPRFNDVPRENNIGNIPRSRTFGDSPIQQTPQFQPPFRPPIAHFASPYIPPPLEQQQMGPPPESPSPQMRPPPVFPSPQMREIREQSPQMKCQIPALPSRKDSLLASQHRSRTISSSSGGSSIAPRGDKLRSSCDNLTTRPQRPPSPITTASPHNASANTTIPRGVPNMLQRNTSPYLHKPPVPTPWQQENLCRDWNQDIDQGNHGNQGCDNRIQPPPQRDVPQRPKGNNKLPHQLSDSSLPVRNTFNRNNNTIHNGNPVVGNHCIGNNSNNGNHGNHGNNGNQGYYPTSNYPPSVMSNTSHTPSNGSSNSEEVVYEYIPEEPHKDQHLHNWLHSYNGPYDDDALSIASENSIMSPRGPPITPPPRLDSKKSVSVDHTTQPWFHGSVSRDSANSLLSSHGKGDGLFLVRNSSNCSTGDFVLSMTHSGHVKHFQITQRGGRPPWYAIEDGPAFPDVIQLIRHYSLNADRLPVKLSSYCMSN